MISVILVTYNSMSVLPSCIHSLEQCSAARELEIVIADGGSSDGTLEWLYEYKERYEVSFLGVQLVRLSSNRGYAYANNRAIERARGDFLLLLNPDTIVQPSTIETCLNTLTKDQTIGAVGCRLLLLDGKLDRACRRSFPTLWNSLMRFSGMSLLFPQSRILSSYNLSYLDECESYPVDCLSGAFMMVPTDVAKKVGPLDEDYFMYGEDIDWCYRVKQKGFKVWYEGKVTTVHLKGGNGGKKSQLSLHSFYATMGIYYRKRHPTRRYLFHRFALRGVLFLMFWFHRGVIAFRKATSNKEGGVR